MNVNVNHFRIHLSNSSLVHTQASLKSLLVILYCISGSVSSLSLRFRASASSWPTRCPKTRRRPAGSSFGSGRTRSTASSTTASPIRPIAKLSSPTFG